MDRDRRARILRYRQDSLCWAVLDSHVPPPRPTGNQSPRVANYRELGEAIEAYVSSPNELESIPWSWPAFDSAWSGFLHGFFRYRSADFFVERPPADLPLEYQVLLAGAAEYLCRRYDLQLPDWITEPRYRMPELFQFFGFEGADEMDLPRLCRRIEPEFLSRNLMFEARNLITL